MQLKANDRVSKRKRHVHNHVANLEHYKAKTVKNNDSIFRSNTTCEWVMVTPCRVTGLIINCLDSGWAELSPGLLAPRPSQSGIIMTDATWEDGASSSDSEARITNFTGKYGSLGSHDLLVCVWDWQGDTLSHVSRVISAWDLEM